MAKQIIDIGSAPNDGTGDPARTAFDKVNDNFTELYDGKVEPNTAFTGDLVFTEAADHASTPAAGFGYLWVKNDAPSSLIFTDDAGTDYDLTSGGLTNWEESGTTFQPKVDGYDIGTAANAVGTLYMNNSGSIDVGTGTWNLKTAGTNRAQVNTIYDAFILSDTTALAWDIVSPDLFLRRKAANQLLQANGASTQYFLVANEYTDASNYSGLWLYGNGKVSSAYLGTGTPQDLTLDGDSVIVELGDAAGAETFSIKDSAAAEVFSVDSDGDTLFYGPVQMANDITIIEAADHASTPTAGSGILWVKSDTPNTLIFTDDAGTDHDLTAGGGGAFTADAQTQITPTTAIVLDEATGNEIALDLSYTVNKATSGNDTGLLINQTDTASPGTSLLADFQAGGASRVSINAGGSYAIQLGGASAGIGEASGSLLLNADGANDYIALKLNLSSKAAVSSAGFTVVDTLPISFGSNVITPTTMLWGDAANTLALRNGTNAQTFNVYNTYTDASNYERGFMKWNAGVFEIGTEAAGTGTQRNIKLASSGSQVIFPQENNSSAPTLAFGDGDTGFYELSDDTIAVTFGGSRAFTWSSTDLRSATTSGAYVQRGAASSTDPVFAFVADDDTGIGRADVDQLSIIAGSVEVLRAVEDTGNAIQLATGQTVAGLPTTPAVGMIARVTDASSPSVGSTVTGGAAAAALVWYNGSNWTVIGV